MAYSISALRYHRLQCHVRSYECCYRSFSSEVDPWKEDLKFSMTVAPQKLPTYYGSVTPMTGMLLISALILDSFQNLRLFRKWEKGMDINPEDETSYTIQYQEAFLTYVDISKKHFRPRGMAPSEWMRSVRAVRDTPVADYSAPGVKTTRRVTYRPPIAVSPFLLALSVSYFKQTLWRCGQL